MNSSNGTAPALFAGVLAAFAQSALAGYTVDVTASGSIDAAVIYSSLDIPGSAVHVDQAGGLSVGDPMVVNNTFSVSDAGVPEFGDIGGLVRDRTFGEDDFAFYSGVTADNIFMTVGAWVTGYDVILSHWRGLDDGVGPHGLFAQPLSIKLALIGEPGTLIDDDWRIIPRTAEEFADAVIGTHLEVSWPNSASYDAFVTNPEFTIIPAPAGLALLALGGVTSTRRRR